MVPSLKKIICRISSADLLVVMQVNIEGILRGTTSRINKKLLKKFKGNIENLKSKIVEINNKFDLKIIELGTIGTLDFCIEELGKILKDSNLNDSYFKKLQLCKDLLSNTTNHLREKSDPDEVYIEN